MPNSDVEYYNIEPSLYVCVCILCTGSCSHICGVCMCIGNDAEATALCIPSAGAAGIAACFSARFSAFLSAAAAAAET